MAAEPVASNVYNYDVVVMGGGPAAFTIALEFSRQDPNKGTPKTLGILSAAPAEGEDTGYDLTELYQGKLSGRLGTRAYKDYLYMGRLNELGGTTNHWGGWNWPFEAYEIASWPIEYQELVVYWKKVQHAFMNMGTKEEPQFHYDDVQWWVEEGAKIGLTLQEIPDTGNLKTRIMQVHNINFKNLYYKQLELCPWITFHHNCNVVKMDTVPSGQQCQVTTMIAKQIQEGRVGQTLFFNAHHHVLAAGAIENTRFLLLNQTPQFPGGIGSSSGHLGEHFRDQTFWNNYEMMSFTLKDDVPEGIRNLYFRLYGQNKLNGDSYFTVALVPKEQLVKDKGISSFRCVFGGVDQTPKIGIIAASVEPKDAPGGKITLTKDMPPDLFGNPRVEVNWQLDEGCIPTAKVMFDETYQVLAPYIVPGDTIRPNFDDGYDNSVWYPDLHPEGTTRMAARPEDGVVDSNLRVFDTTNLYVAGSSTFPTSGYENPTFTIVALAQRLAEHLLTLSCSGVPRQGPSIPISNAVTIPQVQAKLQQALMLELATLPLYLSAMFSLVEDTEFYNFAYPRIWSVVKQEMLHMGLVANVINATGAKPYFNDWTMVPKYPGQGLPGGTLASLKYALAPFSKQQVLVFIDIEHPEQPRESLTDPQLDEEILKYIKTNADFPKTDKTIGQFYEEISQDLKYLDSVHGTALWSGNPALQVTAWGRQLGGPGGKMVKVTDLFTALHAIDEVVKEGEGLSLTNPDDGQCDLAHFFKFVELHACRPIVRSETGYSFGPPVPFNQETDVVNMITLDTQEKGNYTGRAKDANDGFNVAYNALLDGLQAAFNGSPSRVPMMVDIPKDFVYTMSQTLPNGQHACPTWTKIALN